MITTEPYLLIAMDNSEISIGVIDQNINLIFSDTSFIDGKTKAGGQSAARYERNRDLQKLHWYKKINSKLLSITSDKKYEIILGGPGPAKLDLVNYLNNEIKKRIICVKDIGYTSYFGLKELLDKSLDDLKDSKKAKEEKEINRFAVMLAKNNPLACYGLPAEYNNIEILFSSFEDKNLDEKSKTFNFRMIITDNYIIKSLGTCWIKRY